MTADELKQCPQLWRKSRARPRPTHKTLAMSKQGPFGSNRSYNCQNDESGHEVTAFTCIFGQIVAQIAG
jgi:hypothetical protein